MEDSQPNTIQDIQNDIKQPLIAQQQDDNSNQTITNHIINQPQQQPQQQQPQQSHFQPMQHPYQQQQMNQQSMSWEQQVQSYLQEEDQGLTIRFPPKRKKQQQQQQTQENKPDLIDYVDDDQIQTNQILSLTYQPYNIEEGITFSLQTMTNSIKVNSTQIQTMPVQISIKSKERVVQDDTELQNRPNLDLICVIDRSGSMQGEKIEQVKGTLNCLVELLGERDRLSLVTFESDAKRLMPLLKVNLANKPRIYQTIQSIHATGGTDINSGMEIAFKILADRKQKNEVSSIFLLSDGQDNGANIKIQSSLMRSGLTESLTIQSFGFGSDHDPQLMSSISKIKDGNFYYVKDIKTVDEMFVDALGGLFSVVAQDVNITIQADKSNKLFSDINIVKYYGDMWKFDEKSNSYTISITQLLSGSSKEFIFELEIPQIDYKFDQNTNIKLINASLTAKTVEEHPQIFKRETELSVKVFNQDEEVNSDINTDVQMNILRVRGADAIKNAMKEAQSGNFQKGQQLLQDAEDQTMNAIKRAPQIKDRLSLLMNDIEQSKNTCEKSKFESEGKYKMETFMRSHMEQRSQGIAVDEDEYQTLCQKTLVKNRRQIKENQSLGINPQSQQVPQSNVSIPQQSNPMQLSNILEQPDMEQSALQQSNLKQMQDIQINQPLEEHKME